MWICKNTCVYPISQYTGESLINNQDSLNTGALIYYGRSLVFTWEQTVHLSSQIIYSPIPGPLHFLYKSEICVRKANLLALISIRPIFCKYFLAPFVMTIFYKYFLAPIVLTTFYKYVLARIVQTIFYKYFLAPTVQTIFCFKLTCKLFWSSLQKVL